jgi:hypothetical protein
MNWPRNMIEKRLRSGNVAYYWNPNSRELSNGCPVRREALGTSFRDAIERAEFLNQHLDGWRKGRGATKQLDDQPSFGTLCWLVERYKRTDAWNDKVSERSRPRIPPCNAAMRLVLSNSKLSRR